MSEQLTPDQEARVPVIRDKWQNIGFSFGPTDRKKAESYVDSIYRAANLEPPKQIYWAKSPLTGSIIAATLYAKEGQLSTRTKNLVLKNCEEKTGENLDAFIPKKHHTVFQGLIRDLLSHCGYGTHDACWLCLYDYHMPYKPELEVMQPLIDFSQEVGWWWAFDEAIVISDRPQYLCYDDEYRLHHDSRAAISYSDGFGLYLWHGVEVPKYIITNPEQITPQGVLKEGNQELRRIMLERFGWDKLLDYLGAETVHEDEFGKLVKTTKLGTYLDGEDPEARYVLVKDSSTDRRYALRTRPDAQTAHEGIAATFGMDTKQYRPVAEA